MQQSLGKIRVMIEHINSQLKKFRILSERYRNRRKRFGLRINLIAALVNRINNVVPLIRPLNSVL